MQGINIKLPKQWEVTDIGSITTLVSKVDESWPLDKRIKYVDISSIDNSKYLITTPKEFELGDAPSRARQIIQTNDVLFSTVRPYLKNIAKVPKELNNEVCSTGFSVLRSGRGFNTEYLYYYCTSTEFINSLAADQYGVSYPAVKDETVRQKLLPVPPKEEQGRIVEKIEELFSELDKGIESLKTAKAQLAVYRQALLKHAFEGKLTEQWRASNTDKLESPEQLLARIQQEREARYQQQLDDWKKEVEQWEADDKESKKPTKPKKLKVIPSDKAYIESSVKLPFGWEYCSLGELIDEPKYGTSKKCTYDEEGKGVLRIPNVANNIIDSSDLKYATFDEHEIKDYQLNEGDIVIIRSNGSVSLVGKGALINSQDTNFLYAGYLIRLRANSQILYPKYLLYTLQSYPLRKQIEEKAKSTSGVNNINSGELQSLVISLPSLDEQKQVVLELENKISLCESTICDIEDNLKKSELLRQSILKKAFSGQLVPKNSDDEPASGLLKKIAIEKSKLAEKEKAEKAAARKSKSKAKSAAKK